MRSRGQKYYQNWFHHINKIRKMYKPLISKNIRDITIANSNIHNRLKEEKKLRSPILALKFRQIKLKMGRGDLNKLACKYLI